MKHGTAKYPRTIGTIVGLLLALLAPARVAFAQGAPTPLAPGERAYGLTLAEWTAAWLQWVTSIPKATDPSGPNDPNGTRTAPFVAIGQRMPVWFLPSQFGGGTFTRTCTIPAGMSILFQPVATLEHDEPGSATEDELRATLKENLDLDQTRVLEVQVDGVPLPDPKRYRAQTALFAVTWAPGNTFDIPVAVGTTLLHRAVGDAFAILLPPLPPGKHVIQSRWETSQPGPDTSFKVIATWNLTVQEP